LHIPDGYLSPSTCAVLYGAATPFWYISLRRVKHLLNTRVIPTLSAVAAFSFVIMMFNLPLPGGTTGHAVGVGIAAIILGPWASIIAISVALCIQAVFFGDGGITALGANCFNMAIVGSLIAYGTYRLVAGDCPLESHRRVFAAALSGYLAINAAALCAAIEFGVQPMLFKDAAGAPVYAPYPLAIAIPAMMIGHLTLAGLAELVVTGGVIAYLQRADRSHLEATAPHALRLGPDAFEKTEGKWKSTRKLWLGLAVLLTLTPVGLLAAGSAWGEWSLADFADPAAREQIAASSRDQAPPEAPPPGLERLSSLWTAPISHYAPGFMRSPAFGYAMSAIVGVGLIAVLFFVTDMIVSRGGSRGSGAVSADGYSLNSYRQTQEAPGIRTRTRHSGSGSRAGFVEKTVAGLLAMTEHSMFAEEMAAAKGLMQELDPRVKVLGFLSLIVSAILARRLWVLFAIFGVAVGLALASRVKFVSLASRIWAGALLLTGPIAVPAMFLIPGIPLGRLPILGWTVTAQGLSSAVYLIARVETAVTLSSLLVLCTPWTHVLKALRVLGLPSLIVVILGMTHRFIFVMLQAARDMFESRRSRMVGNLSGGQGRRLASATVGVLFNKATHLSGDVYLAMQSRGFVGEAYTLDDFAMRLRDWISLAALLTLAMVAFWLGRA
jgi:cobalt/nickel transport system permease protein